MDSTEHQTHRQPAAGPLVVSKANPRYFAVASSKGGEDEKVVYLTGSHIWNNLHDGVGPGLSAPKKLEQNDYTAYLNFLQDHGHNFIRLWRWEHFQSQAPGGANFHLCMSPQPWPRTGPGTAKDGQPKFDLSKFDQAYFDRLRERVAAASDKGIYVDVMLFDGFAMHLSPLPDNIEGHPFYADNNVNSIGITSSVDYQVLPLAPRVQALQEAYIRKVIDTVHDLPNVLYEVANEASGDTAKSVKMPDGSALKTPVGDSTPWQYGVIDFVRHYEQKMGYDKHPIGMTYLYPVPNQSKANAPLFKSTADWISPGFDAPMTSPAPGEPPVPSQWLVDPPENDGAKIILTDTDHYAPGPGDLLWVWKSFLRGHHPVLMDYGIIDVVQPLPESPGLPSYESSEPARYAMGDTLRFAERMNLAKMEPRGELSSTKYALANQGEEYLVLEPAEKAETFTVTLAPGSYTVEWYNVGSRETTKADSVTAKSSAPISFSAPFKTPGPAVLYLQKAKD